MPLHIHHLRRGSRAMEWQLLRIVQTYCLKCSLTTRQTDQRKRPRHHPRPSSARSLHRTNEVCSATLQKQPGFTSLQVPGPITSSRSERRVCTASLGADPAQLEDQGHLLGGVQAVVPLIPISSDASFQGMQRLIDPNTMPQGRRRGDKTPPSL